MKKRNRNRNRNQAPAQNPTATPLSKADTARINGAKSHGPTSDAGKARSSQNGLKHGLTSKRFMLMPPEQAEFELHLTAAIAHWAPKTDYELYLVTKIARADFQHDRAEDLQVNLLDLETDIIGADIERTFEAMDDTGALALGYKSLNDKSSAPRNLDRHIARLARERVQARKALAEAIDHRLKREAAAEPAPASQPLPEPETQKLQSEPTAPAATASPAVTPIDSACRAVCPAPATQPPAEPETQKLQSEPTAPAATVSPVATPIDSACRAVCPAPATQPPAEPETQKLQSEPTAPAATVSPVVTPIDSACRPACPAPATQPPAEPETKKLQSEPTAPAA